MADPVRAALRVARGGVPMTTRPTILDGEDHATDAHRAALLWREAKR